LVALFETNLIKTEWRLQVLLWNNFCYFQGCVTIWHLFVAQKNKK